MLPFSRCITAQRDRPVLTGNAFDFSQHQAGIVPVSLDIAQVQAALHGFEAPEGQESIHKSRDTVKFQSPISFFRIGNPVNGRPAEFGLHDFAAGIDRGLPGGIHKAESPAVFRHVTENLHGDFN